MFKRNFLILSLLTFISCKPNTDYYNLPIYSKNNLVQAVVEIPAGTNKKYEYNKQSKSFQIDKKNGKDRVIQYLPYLGNYGFIPSTYSDPKEGGDGDALDVLILSESAQIGTIIEITPIAVLKLIDDGELDYKIIAIPHNPTQKIIKVSTLEMLSKKHPEIMQMVEYWFLNYNKADTAEVEGWGDEIMAQNEIKKHRKLNN